MTEARIGRRPVTAGKAGILRPEASHQAPQVRVSQEQSARPKTESGLRNPAIQETTRVAGIRAEIAQENRPTAQPQRPAQQNGSGELLELAEKQIADEGTRKIRGGMYHQENRAKENSPKLLQWYTPDVTQLYTIDNPDGTQTVYAESLRKSGVYEEQYGKKGKFGGRKLISRTLIGETMDFEPERNPDGSMTESKAYKGEVRIFSKEHVEKGRKVEKIIDEEPLEETIKRLNAKIVPFPQSQAEIMQTIQKLALIQGSMSMVKDSIKEQAILGAETTLITGASSAFLFGVPISVFGTYSFIIKPILDLSVVMEAYKLVRTPTSEEVKEKLKPINLIFSLIKNPVMLVQGLIQQAENSVKLLVAQQGIMNDFKKQNPHIRDRRMRGYMIDEEAFQDSHEQWLKHLRRINPHLSDEAIESVARKLLSYQKKNLKQIDDDFQKVQRVMMFPMGVFLGVEALGIALSPLTGGLSVPIANVAAPLVSGIARPIINYRLLKDLKAEIQKDRPEELVPIQQQIQQITNAPQQF